MTAGELIERLKELDPETRIFTQGYEGGLEEVSNVGKISDILLNVNQEWYYGPHELTKSIPEDVRSKYETVKGVIL